ncbi:MAG: hypothetical protein ABIJ36_02990 [Patescibacteria group bacterium]|nr:hypothetical protein [Patescibacteria group bacterium]
MRNDVDKPKIKNILSKVENLPFFSLDDLLSVEANKAYLKTLLSRYARLGKVTRLKKGVYTMKTGFSSDYTEFVACTLYLPSYLSLEYSLYYYNILTEIPVNFTLITKKKTASFSNKIGRFFYHKIKTELFCGFNVERSEGFYIFKATKAKALFDFLYLRKNMLADEKSVLELRLNLSNINKRDMLELEKYVSIEGSKKMKLLFAYLNTLWKQF